MLRDKNLWWGEAWKGRGGGGKGEAWRGRGGGGVERGDMAVSYSSSSGS